MRIAHTPRLAQAALAGPLQASAEVFPCRPPILFCPPSPLVRDPELWCLTTGLHDEWGGAQVLVSEEEDGDRPWYAGTVDDGAVMGKLLDALPAGGGTFSGCPHFQLFDDGHLTVGSEAQARRWETLCYLGDGRDRFELIAYAGLKMIEPVEDTDHIYAVDGFLVRGLYGTLPRPWPAGTLFGRLDQHGVTIPLEYRWRANRVTLTLRFLSLSGLTIQDSADGEEIDIADDLATIPRYQYTVR